MRSELLDAFPASRTIRIGEKDFDVRPASMVGLARLQGHLNALPKPGALRALKPDLEGLPESVVRDLVMAAQAEDSNWPPELMSMSDKAQHIFMTTVEGCSLLLEVALGLSADAARELMGRVTPVQFSILFATALGAPSDDAELAIRLEDACKSAALRGRSAMAEKLYGMAQSLMPKSPEDPTGGGPGGDVPAVSNGQTAHAGSSSTVI